MESYYVEIAKEIAKVAHAGQYDKGGKPYINHPETVAALLDTTEEKVCGWLHDVLEDTDFNPEVLHRLFGDEVMGTLYALNHRPNESWWNYIGRVAKNPLAIRVKLADLTHNMDISRIPNPGEKDYRRLDRYRMTFKYLTDKLNEYDE